MSLKSMRPAKSKDKDAMPQEDGIDVHLSHDHLAKLGVKTPPAVGTKVQFQGEGEVTSSHSSDGEGGPHHSMRVTMHKADMQHDAKADMRGDVQAAADAVAAKRGSK